MIKNFKKSISFILVTIVILTLLISLTACGKKENTNINNQDSIFDETGQVEGKLHIGDYVAYNEGTGNKYTVTSSENSENKINYVTDGKLKWRVFSYENGKINLICDTSILPKTDKQLKQTEINSILDEICAIYGKGEGAENARSISIEDIKKYMEFTGLTSIGGSTKGAWITTNIYKPDEHIDKQSNKYDVLFRNEEKLYKEYVINSDESIYEFSRFLYYMYGDPVLTGDYAIRYANSDDTIMPVLPIVTLKADIEFDGQDENGVWQIKNSDKNYAETEFTEIANEEDYLKLLNGKYNLGKNYKLVNDLDLSKVTGVAPIKEFKGVFDGNNHKITGLKINITESGEYGFFSKTTGATIKNLNIENAIITLDGSGELSSDVELGVLVGNATDTNIINCTVNGKIKGNAIESSTEDKKSWEIGMLCANFTNGNVIDTKTLGSINIQSEISSDQSGYMVFCRESLVENCSSEVDIEVAASDGANSACGFLAYCTNSTVSNCNSKGLAEAQSIDEKLGHCSAFGFIYQLNAQSVVLKSYSLSEVIATDWVGGICAYVNTTIGDRYIKDCYYAGTVKLTGEAKNFELLTGGNVDAYSSYIDAKYITNDGEQEIHGNEIGKAGKIINMDSKKFYSKDAFTEFNFDYVWKWDENNKRPQLMYE